MGSLEDIAKIAKVSASTVSRALSGQPGVSETKRKIIKDLAREMGFEPNIQASLLRTGKGAGLAIVTSTKQTEIAIKRESLILDYGKKSFSNVKLFVMNESDEINCIIHRICADRYNAIIINGFFGDIHPQNRKLLNDRKIPVCTIDGFIDSLDNVLFNRSTGTYQAARMLLLSGCKNPVFFLSGHSLDNINDPRLKGICEGFKSLGRPISEINKIPFTDKADYEKGFSLSNETINKMPVDGIFAYNDVMAIGALRALHKAGINVPDDIRLIGFDDIPVSAFLPVSITTAAQPLEDAARAAVEIVKRRIDSFDIEPVTLSLPTRLVVRESAPITDNKIRDEIFKIPENL